MKLGKRVLLINTADVLSIKGLTSFYNIAFPNVLEDLLFESFIPWKDEKIPYYQSARVMPDIDEMRDISDFIIKNRPYFIMSLGSFNLTADLFSNIIPVVSVPLGFSELPITESQFHLVTNEVSEADRSLLMELGFDESNLIPSVFTFDFNPQKGTYTRNELGIPESKFVLAVVGGRLDDEISDEFLDVVVSMDSVGIHTVFIGVFDTYPQKIAQDPQLARCTTYLGLQDDVLAILEVCNLYVNPERLGGGSSVVEAMYKGLPAVTLGLGDVAVNTGADFWVNSLAEMKMVIERYARDQEFYSDMTVKAKQRAKLLTNTGAAMANLIQDIEKSSLFQ